MIDTMLEDNFEEEVYVTRNTLVEFHTLLKDNLINSLKNQAFKEIDIDVRSEKMYLKVTIKTSLGIFEYTSNYDIHLKLLYACSYLEDSKSKYGQYLMTNIIAKYVDVNTKDILNQYYKSLKSVA